MKADFIISRNGKQYILYKGLLDMAHEAGLVSIHTKLLQIPNDANNKVAICMATVCMAKDGEVRTFTGIGDAAANNVTPAMQTCLIRMAETRSKARALRDAVNVGVAAFEELGGEEHEEKREVHPAGMGERTDNGEGRVQRPQAREPAQAQEEGHNFSHASSASGRPETPQERLFRLMAANGVPMGAERKSQQIRAALYTAFLSRPVLRPGDLTDLDCEHLSNIIARYQNDGRPLPIERLLKDAKAIVAKAKVDADNLKAAGVIS